MSSSPVTIKGADHSKKEIHVQNTWQHSDAHHALLGKEMGFLANHVQGTIELGKLKN